jgi:YVTN family beta-propeller protein
VAHFSTGAYPVAGAYDPSTNQIFFANEGTGTVSVVNVTTNSVVANISGFEEPHAVAYSFSSQMIYVVGTGAEVNNSTCILWIVNPNLDNIVSAMHLGTCDYGTGIVYNPANEEMYISQFQDNSIWALNTLTNKVVAKIGVGEGPVSLALNTFTDDVYVGSIHSAPIDVISPVTNKVVGRINGDYTLPEYMAFDPSNNYLYAGWNDVITVFNTSNDSVVTTMTNFDGMGGIVYNPANDEIYVSNHGVTDYHNHTVSVVNGTEIVGTVKVGPNPAAMVVS